MSLEPQTAVELGEGSPAPSAELLGCGPQVGSGSWGPAGELCGDRGALVEERGVLPVPSPCLCLCPAPALPALLAASSVVPLARCCPAFRVSALTDVLNSWNHSVVHLPDAFPVLQLAGMAGELGTDHLLGLVDKAARLPKADCGEHTVSG